MFRWYKNSTVCYVWLSDLPIEAPNTKPKGISRRTQYRWFTRGWTLQELLAAQDMRFFDQEWNLIGTKSDFTTQISAISGINKDVLADSQTIFLLVYRIYSRDQRDNDTFMLLYCHDLLSAWYLDPGTWKWHIQSH